MQPVLQYVRHTLAAVTIAAIPAFALAQTPAAAQPNPAAEHLSAARAALNKVLNAPAPNGDAFKKLTELKTHYIALERAASTASPEWKTHYKEIDQLVTDLVGGSSAEPGAVGTSGRAGAAAAKGLDPAVAANLRTFRTHLAAFGASMAPAAPSTPPPAAAPPAPPATPPTPPAPETPATPPAPAAPAASAMPPAAPATPPAADADIVTPLDQIAARIDSVLAANPASAGGTVSVDRAMLEQIKAELEQTKQRVKKP